MFVFVFWLNFGLTVGYLVVCLVVWVVGVVVFVVWVVCLGG